MSTSVRPGSGYSFGWNRVPELLGRLLFAAMLGTALGLVAALADAGPQWMQWSNLPSVWLGISFFAGALCAWRTESLVAGTLAVLAAVGTYYLVLLGLGIRQYVETVSIAAQVWAIAGLATGPVLGMMGWTWRHRRGSKVASVAAALFAGWLWFEAAWVAWSGVEEPTGYFAIGTAAVGLAVILSTGNRRTLAWALPLAVGAALIAGIAGPVVLRELQCAAGGWCQLTYR